MMLKFTKLSENSSKIIYEIMNGDFGTVEYDKKTGTVVFLNSDGSKNNTNDFDYAFSFVIKNNFPKSYIYAAG